MEVFNELIESEVSIIIPHVADIIGFCLEVRAAVHPPPPPPQTHTHYILIDRQDANEYVYSRKTGQLLCYKIKKTVLWLFKPLHSSIRYLCHKYSIICD